MNQATYDALTKIGQGILDLRDSLADPAPKPDPDPIPPEKPKVVLGLNLAALVDYSPEIVFNDVIRQSRQWTSQVEGGAYNSGPPLALDEHGDVLRLESDKHFTETMVFTDLAGQVPAGNYVLDFMGRGTIEFNGMATGRYSGAGSMVPVNPNMSTFLALRIRGTDPSDPIRKITLCVAGHTAARYEQEFVKRYMRGREPVYGVLRFMDWMNVNSMKAQPTWNARPNLADRSWGVGKGVAVEAVTKMCNAAQADPWICVHHLADDSYVRSLASYLHDMLNPSRKIYVEFSNECWNAIMPQAKWCRDQGVAKGLATDPYEAQIRFYSEQAVRVFGIFSVVFHPSRVVRVMAAHHQDLRTGQWALEHKNAYDYSDALAVAPYWGHSRATVATFRDGTVDQILDACRRDIGQNVGPTRQYKNLALSKGLSLVAYEGGQHLVAPDKTDKAVVQKLIDANRHERMADLYDQDLQFWENIGGETFCLFSSMSKYDEHGCWGLLERYDQETSPKLEGVKRFLKERS